MKIFGIGLNKTGTTSLGQALEILGYKKHLKSDLELLNAWSQGSLEVIQAAIDENEVFEDWPWPLTYEWVADKYPDAKFILTTRSSSERWFKSLCKHADKTGPTQFRKIVYGHEMPHEFMEHHITYYNKHNENVRSFFKDNGLTDRLLELCWEHGDGWNQLCPFLNHKVPSRDFPTANKSGTSLQKKIWKKIGF
ncbi:MAG: hypothetical protein JXR10_16165 [Cyclobacteriaceae bacterium]